MSVTYVRNSNGAFEQVGPGGATTDITLSQLGKPADAAAVGAALTNYATAASVSSQMSTKVDKISGKTLSTNDFTNAYKNGLDELMSHSHNMFNSLTEIGITTFPTTMNTVASAMPANSMIVIDTRRVNGSGTDYSTETISDWNNTTNGMALIMKGATNARVTMMILYGSSESDHGDWTVGNYAANNDTVSWTTSADMLDKKVNKITNKSAVDLNTLTEPGFYFVSSGTTALNFPIGVNGHLLVMNDGSGRIRQLFMRLGTADSNNFQWYTRTCHTSTWSRWWLVCGQEKVWNGGTVLNSEINIGSRYGCQSWVVVARLQNTGALSSVVIPRAFLTDEPEEYGRWQIADEECWISFYFYYKEDNNVYLKVIDQTDSEYTTLKYVYRTT